jgi:hypothetical protein
MYSTEGRVEANALASSEAEVDLDMLTRKE